MGMAEDVLVHARLREVRAYIQKTNEEISTIRGNWEAATIKLQGLDSKVEKVRAQLHTTNQELTTKMIDDRVLLMKQSGQVEKVENNIGGDTDNIARIGHRHGENSKSLNAGR